MDKVFITASCLDFLLLFLQLFLSVCLFLFAKNFDSMPNQFIRKVKKSMGSKYRDINPEDIFLDSTNLPGLNRERFEGKMERPIGRGMFFWIKIILVVVI